MNYQINKQKARTRTTKPSLTDGSQARDTDINVIVRRMGVTGMMPQSKTQPMSGDFTGLPTDLRGFIETSRKMNRHHSQLPKELKNLPIEELLALTPEEMKKRITPPTKEAPNGIVDKQQEIPKP